MRENQREERGSKRRDHTDLLVPNLSKAREYTHLDKQTSTDEAAKYIAQGATGIKEFEYCS